MDVFSLRDTVVGEYRQFATSFTTIHAEDIQRQVEAIYAQERYWPEPLVQINPSYQRITTVEKMVAEGTLEPACAEIFRDRQTAANPRGETLSLYKHQEESIVLAKDGESYVVTTGTGSGKSLCFFIPIVSAVLADKRRGGGKRTRAVVIYPMNALANSQYDELEKFLKNTGPNRPVTFARYTGQDESEERQRIADDPPDILLTNFMMLELLMTRQHEQDRKVIGNCAGLSFLVLDELHTYRGRQGADVALLVRRVRERLAPEKLQCIGTSATMASEGSAEHKSRIVSRVASKLFSAEIPESNVVVERLETMQPSLPIGPVHETVIPPPETFQAPAPWARSTSLREWIAPRVAELVCVSADLASFGRAILGRETLFAWDPIRRELIQAELDAMAFHHFGLARPEVEHVLSTFPKVRDDERAHGEYRTKRVILEIYDDLAEAIRTGRPHQTRLDPPPADPRVAHPPRADAATTARRGRAS